MAGRSTTCPLIKTKARKEDSEEPFERANSQATPTLYFYKCPCEVRFGGDGV